MVSPDRLASTRRILSALLALVTSLGLHAQTLPQEGRGVQIAYIDTTVSPCEDFYQYANGVWFANATIPADRSFWGSGSELYERNLALLHSILEDAAAKIWENPGRPTVTHRPSLMPRSSWENRLPAFAFGDTRCDVIRKIGQLIDILPGDMRGEIYVYANAPLKYTLVTISDDRFFGLGVIGVEIAGAYGGVTHDGIGIKSERSVVIDRLGMPDTTTGQPPIDDHYSFPTCSFLFTYENQRVFRITMGTRRRFF
jgi:hypothetical protein